MLIHRKSCSPSPSFWLIAGDTWPHLCYRPLATVALILQLAAPCAAQTGSVLPPANRDPAAAVSEVPAAVPAVPDEALDQINALRQQMGGGVAEQLRELIPDDREGQRMLQQTFDDRFRSLRARPAGMHGVGAASAGSHGHQGRLRVIRRAARQIESVAADLEEVAAYQLADDVRAQASRLWQQARRGPTSASAELPAENPPRPLAP